MHLDRRTADLIEQIEKTEERGNNARTMSEPVSDDTRRTYLAQKKLMQGARSCSSAGEALATGEKPTKQLKENVSHGEAPFTACAALE